MPLNYAELPPHPDLLPLIECYWRVHGTSPAVPPAERIVPDACPELILHRGDVFSRQVGARWVRQPRLFLAGTLSRPWRVRPGREVDTIGIRFRPGAITALFDIDMRTAVDREVPGTEFLDGTALAAVSVVTATRTPRRLASSIDAWLLPRLARTGPRGHELTGRAIALLLRSRGRRRIEDVAQRIGVPRRRLERLFARDLGIRPKLFARIVRLNHALARLERDEREGAVDAALAAGYFDQAHMSRDFRMVAGRHPSAARSADGSMAQHFTRPERLMKWLAGE